MRFFEPFQRHSIDIWMYDKVKPYCHISRTTSSNPVPQPYVSWCNRYKPSMVIQCCKFHWNCIKIGKGTAQVQFTLKAGFKFLAYQPTFQWKVLLSKRHFIQGIWEQDWGFWIRNGCVTSRTLCQIIGHPWAPCSIKLPFKPTLLHFFLHRSMWIFNTNSMVWFSLKTNQKWGQYDFSKFLELISFVLF